jgi:hypothetical protein
MAERSTGAVGSPHYVTAIDPGEFAGVATFRDGVLVQATLGGFVLVGEVVIENPTIRRNTPNPNDILVLARRVGRLEEAAERLRLPCTLYTPSQWKASVDKDMMIDRIKTFVTADERHIVESAPCTEKQGKNIWDAVGIGLFHLGRMRRGGVA